jgi:MFS family permease
LKVACAVLDRYELYIVGQFLQGLGQSFTPALVLFLAESMPDRWRGKGVN